MSRGETAGNGVDRLRRPWRGRLGALAFAGGPAETRTRSTSTRAPSDFGSHQLMAHRTFAVGDIHGDLRALTTVLERLPLLDAADTLVFLGDYMDRGPQSAEVVQFLRRDLPRRTAARLVFLRGNHEDAWLRVISGEWPEFVEPPGNGCLACYRSFTGGPVPDRWDLATPRELAEMRRGAFFPMDVVDWMRSLAWWYEDEHAIYVHAGLPRVGGVWQHPSLVRRRVELLWLRDGDFFRYYRGKRVVVGHTATRNLPPELSSYTSDDPQDLWAGDNVVAIDTGSGKGGFLTAVELPVLKTYESRG